MKAAFVTPLSPCGCVISHTNKKYKQESILNDVAMKIPGQPWKTLVGALQEGINKISVIFFQFWNAASAC